MRGGSGNIKKKLWKRASIMISDEETQYLPEQCEHKWKNIKQAYNKVNLLTLIRNLIKKSFIHC